MIQVTAGVWLSWGEMATYFERMRAGMQVVQQLFEELQPDARCEWGPMDNGANYPFFLVREGRKLLLYRFSKDSLVAMSDESHRAKARASLADTLRLEAHNRGQKQGRLAVGK